MPVSARVAAYYCLPICGLPREDEGSRKDGVRVLPGEAPNGFLQAAQGNAPMLVRHVPDRRAASQVRHMHGRKRQQGMQDVFVGRADPEDSRSTGLAGKPTFKSAVSWAAESGGVEPYVGICRVQRVKSLAPISCIWSLMEATWWINLRSSSFRPSGEGAG